MILANEFMLQLFSIVSHEILPDLQHKIPTKALHVHDVSGAGDTVISTFVLAELSGANGEESALLANYAAGFVCGEVGVVPITLDNLTKMVEYYLY